MCKVCGFTPCACYKPYCDPCRDEECINERVECVVYRLDDDSVNHLSCLNVSNNSTVETFLNKLEERVCRILSLQLPLETIDTESINLTASGIVDHTLQADVILAPNVDNSISILSDGLFSSGEDGKIKVDALDTKDYLVEQIAGASDGVVNVSVYDQNHLLITQPSINISALLSEIRTNHLTKFCSLVTACS